MRKKKKSRLEKTAGIISIGNDQGTGYSVCGNCDATVQEPYQKQYRKKCGGGGYTFVKRESKQLPYPFCGSDF